MKIEKEYKKSTLMNWKKEDLVEHILCLIHNNNVLHDTLDTQAQNYINATRWIPVSERLPNAKEYCKNDGRSIVTDGNKVKQGLFDIYADGQHDPYWPYQSCQPIAWMPLPEPYRPED